MSLQAEFLKNYEILNEEQKLAVDTLEGPVMVIAGPGTGKTQILSARIGKILLETDSRPENILCLTYTDAGVVAMRRRLIRFIGPDAYKVRLYTFHAFCNEVIQENLHLFEKQSLDPISELEKIELYKTLIDGLPKNHPLKRYRGDVYYEMNPMRSLFSTMKREGWTPAYINLRIDEYITSLPQLEIYTVKRATGIFKKGDTRLDKIAEETEKIEKLRAAVYEFDHFQALMKARNRYDFDDMVNWVIDAFRQNEPLLRNYQEQFLYILVDEYQDTSGTQNQLVQLLINYWDKPNVFVVGDDDQSIFRFQGANVENMKAIRETYQKDLLTVVLSRNYRSVQPVLDLSKTLIENNRQRLIYDIPGLTKDLIAVRKELKDLQPAAAIQVCETLRQEMIHLALSVRSVLDLGLAQPSSIAIIFKENKFGQDLAEYLKNQNIPVYSKRSLNVLAHPIITKITTVFSYLASEHDVPFSGDELLFEILHYNWFNIPSIEIAKLSVEVSMLKYGTKAKKTSLRLLLDEKANSAPKDLFSINIHPGLARASRVLEGLISEVANLTLQGLLEQVIQETGLLQKIIQLPDKNAQVQVLTSFFDFVKEETHRNPALSLQALVKIIELMQNEKIALPLLDVTGSEKGVNLLTAHGSKGLEFEYVFIAGCNSAIWEKKRKPSPGYRMPPNLFVSRAATGPAAEVEELRRLFYVAITRAEKHLTLTYHRFGNDGKEKEPSLFLEEIQAVHHIPVQPILISPKTLTHFQLLQMQGQQAPEIGRLEDEWVNRLLESFVMNATALNNFMNCPLEFYYKNLIRIPSPKNENAQFGSAVHSALEQLFRAMQTSNDQFPALSVLLSYFDTFMHRHRESFTKEQFDRRMEHGHNILPAYYERNISVWNKIVAIEQVINGVVVLGVPLKGKLDKLEFDRNSVNVVDYKTGNPDNGKKRLVGPGEKNPDGGDYWRQAVFYKILVDNNPKKNWVAASAEFDFVEPDAKKVYSKIKLIISEQDVATVTNQITTAWEKIQAHQFYVGCGKADCHWCNFVKTNDLSVALHGLSVESPEELDLKDY